MASKLVSALLFVFTLTSLVTSSPQRPGLPFDPNAIRSQAQNFGNQLASSIIGNVASQLPPGISLPPQITNRPSPPPSSPPPPPPPPQDQCPAVWRDLANDLRGQFAGCNALARFAIRFAFHDAAGFSVKTPFYGPSAGGADGSILLFDEEVNRIENRPMDQTRPWLLNVYNQYKSRGVGAADLIQFANAVALTACPGSPRIPVLVGRQDANGPCPTGMMPPPFGPGATADALTSLFADKGLSATDMSALLGAHTVSKSRALAAKGIPAGSPQDTTPSTWDTKFFNETMTPTEGMKSFDSDTNIAKSRGEAGDKFALYAVNKDQWDRDFTAAMGRMIVTGISDDQKSRLVDCAASVYD